jgi:hypothetical protein
VKPVSEGAALDDVVGPNGETLQELFDQVTPENGGLIADASGFAIGDPNSQREYEEKMARGSGPKSKGPKPTVLPPYRDRSTRQLPEGWKPAPTGPERPEDAWKWQGVPTGRGLVGRVEPGKTRYYMDYDEHGPRVRWLPPAWPDSDAGSSAGSSAESNKESNAE